MAQKSVGLRLDEGLLARIDADRGDVPRARWVARAAEKLLALHDAERGAEAAAEAIVVQPERFGSSVVGTAREVLAARQAKREVRPIPKGQ